MSHYYAQHAVALKAELSQAIPRDELRAFHRKSALRHFIVAIRQFAILGLATWGLIRFENPLIWIPLAFVQGFTVFNFTVLLARGPAPQRVRARAAVRDAGAGLAVCHAERHLGEPVHALAPRPSRRARVRRGRSQAPSPVAEGQRALVQAAVCDAGALPDLLPRRPAGDGDLSRRAAADDRRRAHGVDRRAPLAIAALWSVFGVSAALRTSSSRSSSSSRSRSR